MFLLGPSDGSWLLDQCSQQSKRAYQAYQTPTCEVETSGGGIDRVTKVLVLTVCDGLVHCIDV